MNAPQPALLVLCDGEVFEGEAVGAPAAVASGEVVFNTVMSGYQEVISDPSYAGQMIAFTYPHIGNYGTNDADSESVRPHCRGVIVRDLARRHSSWRADDSLDGFLRRHGVPAITGIDTRRLTRHIRDAGAMPGAFGTADEATLLAAARAEPGTSGVDLVAEVTTAEPYTAGTGPRRVVAYDLGIKSTILRCLGELATVTVVPASTPAADVLAREPDGVFVSNGPGDPELAGPAIEALRTLVGTVPVFGICLGHQLLGPRPRRTHLQDALRPPRRQRARALHRHRQHRDHQPEPQLRGGGRIGARRDRDPRLPQRRRPGRALGGRRRRLQRAVPP